LLNAGGTAIVQTLHPVIACGDAPYVDGWRHRGTFGPWKAGKRYLRKPDFSQLRCMRQSIRITASRFSYLCGQQR
jgi:hypothetical protein